MKENKNKKQSAKEHFEKDLTARGEAVKKGVKPLPPGATHEIVEDKEGKKTLQRRRYSILPPTTKP